MLFRKWKMYKSRRADETAMIERNAGIAVIAVNRKDQNLTADKH